MYFLKGYEQQQSQQAYPGYDQSAYAGGAGAPQSQNQPSSQYGAQAQSQPNYGNYFL